MRHIEESPTRASTRATTRIAMLNKITDRVQQSQEGKQILHDNSAMQQPSKANKSFLNARSNDWAGDEGSISVDKTSHPSGSLRYDIETLIELGSKVLDFSKVLLKIKPEAIAENLFQYMGMERSLRPTARSRGLSDITNLSQRSLMSSTEWEPSCQTRAAPHSSETKHMSFLHQHEGFIQFLKQHASPPNHRVTAGGRIVPTGPLSPPPMFDYASLNGLLEDQQGRTHARAGVHNTLQNHPGFEPTIASNQFKARSTYPMFQGDHAPVPQAMDADMQYHTQVFTNPINPTLPSSIALTPIGMFPDGTSLISCNGICYRCYWNGITTVMEPLTIGQPLLAPTVAQLVDHSIPVDKAPYTFGIRESLPPSSLPQSTEVPFMQASALPNTSDQRKADVTASANSFHHEDGYLKAQLTGLDKYMALNHFDIRPSVKQQLVARRKSLVEAIAKLRSDREPSTQTIPIVSTSHDVSRKSSTQSGANRVLTQTQCQKQNPSLNRKTSETASFKKCLSPSAPAFVPQKFAASSAKSSVTLAPVRETGPQIEMPDSSVAMQTSDDSLGKPPQNEHRIRQTSSSSADIAYVEVDPWDPAMKIVPPSMIDYAQKYKPKNTGAGKKFCTTTEEFQEAIRRVREQARMWGCVGGNSKDPAYDAEEDIWYAIKDEYPIPLPSPTPDHIKCPRPWNWYDSAFNVNATIEPKINMRGHNLQEDLAQSRKSGPARNTSVNMSIVKSRHSGAARNSDEGLFLKTLTQRSTSVGGPHLARDSGALPDQYENEQPCENNEELSSRKSHGFRRETSRTNHNVRDQKYNDSLFPMKEVTPMSVAPIYKPKAKEAMPPSPLALSAAQAAHSSLGVRSSHLGELRSRPETPSSSPTKTRSGASSKNLNAIMSQTPSEHTRKVKQDNDLVSSESEVVWESDQLFITRDDPVVPRVNIPKNSAIGQLHFPGDDHNPHKVQPSTKAPVDHEADLDHAVSIQNAYSKDFLKDMLKEPRYSLEHQHSYVEFLKSRPSMMDLAIAQQMAANQRENELAKKFATPEQRNLQTMDKQKMTNQILRKHADTASKYDNHVANASSSNFSLISTPQAPLSLATSKALSSMAATNYHAQGYLPSYGGAGKAHAASVYRHQTHAASMCRPRVNLPLASSHNQSSDLSDQTKQQKSHDRSSQGTTSRYIPIMFGYDGSEEPATDDKHDLSREKNSQEEKGEDGFTDRKEVTTADFDNHRPDHDNEWHRGAVNDFFRDLHEKEVKYMMARQRKNTKTAP